MSRRRVHPEQERTNRNVLVPADASLRSHFWYGVVTMLGTWQEFILDFVIKQPCWRSSDGEVLLMSQMRDRHLINAIRMLERTGGHGRKLRQLHEELERRTRVK